MVTKDMIGQMFSVPWSPNPHRLEWIRPKHCQMHGDYIGEEAGFLKRRNSETRKWGNAISLCMVDTAGIKAWEAATNG